MEINESDMKRVYRILSIATAAFLAAACYDDYVRDYEYSGAFFAYQYDLRTFVVGEGEEITLGAALGGVIDNTRDRNVRIVRDDALLTEDLSYLSGREGTARFTAYDGLLGNSGGVGDMSNDYVKTEVLASGIKSLVPVPENYVTILDNPGDLHFDKGNHIAKFRIKAEEAFLSDTRAMRPGLAIGFKIVSADVDTVLSSKSFTVVALKYENKFFGNWYHGGETKIVSRDGTVLSTDVVEMKIPQSTAALYTLSTASPSSVFTDKVGNASGKLLLSFDGDRITVSDPSGATTIRPVEGLESRFNGAKLLQDRELYLNYQFDNADGTVTVVKDTLLFRNRIRDGINEWQDLNPENYK